MVLGSDQYQTSPLCENFEYFSEDPYLTESWRRDISRCTDLNCTSLKHYAVNSQETSG